MQSQRVPSFLSRLLVDEFVCVPLKYRWGKRMSSPMNQYRCYFLTADNRTGSHRDFEARNDAEAIIRARAFYTEQRFWHGFELWCGPRRVYADASCLTVSRQA